MILKKKKNILNLCLKPRTPARSHCIINYQENPGDSHVELLALAWVRYQRDWWHHHQWYSLIMHFFKSIELTNRSACFPEKTEAMCILFVVNQSSQVTVTFVLESSYELRGQFSFYVPCHWSVTLLNKLKDKDSPGIKYSSSSRAWSPTLRLRYCILNIISKWLWCST